MPRSGRPDVAVATRATGPEHTTDTQWVSPVDAAIAAGVRATAQADTEAVRALSGDRAAFAQGEVPLTRTDASNPRMDRAMPAAAEIRVPLTSRRKKRLSATKTKWQGGLSTNRAENLNRLTNSRAKLGSINRRLEAEQGFRSKLRVGTGRDVHAIDGAIAEYEAQNEGQHIVYAVLRSPRSAGSSRAALRRRIDAMIADPDNHRPIAVDGYTPSTHDLGQVRATRDVVMEIRTRSGAYLGMSDSRPESDHLIGRGRMLRPVAVQDVAYQKSDGSQGVRTIVQMDDVTGLEAGT